LCDIHKKGDKNYYFKDGEEAKGDAEAPTATHDQSTDEDDEDEPPWESKLSYHVPVLAVAYCTVGVFAFMLMEGWSLTDSVYFIATTVTTVGYGDLQPTKSGSKLFFVLYILFGAFIAAAAIGFVFEKMTSKAFYESGFERHLFASLDKSIGKLQRKMLVRVLWVTTIIIVGGIILAVINEFNMVDGIYVSVASATSIGYGDLKMSSHPAARWVIAIFVVIATISMAALFVSFAVLWMEYEHRKRVEATVLQGVSLKMLKAMDHDHDGEVTRDEFLSFLVIKLARVEPRLIDKLNDLFDEADVDENGILDVNDVRLHQQMRGRY